MVQPLVRHFWATPAWVAVLHRLGSLVLAFGLGAGSALSGVATAAAAPGATFVVDSTADAVDTHPGDGQCRTSAGSCTLRAAVQEANVHAGTDTISLPAGTYSLTIAGKDEDQGATGDLDIHDSLTITGAGAASSIVDGGGLDRVLQVFGPAAVQLSGVTIRGGFAFRGGGIYSSGELRLLSSTVTANSAGGFPSPPPDPSSCCPQNQGGGIYNDGGGVALDSVTVSNNQVNPADDDMDSAGGGLFSDSARPLTLNNVTFEGNRTSSTRFIQGGGGGGVASGGGGLVTLNGGLFAGNSTPGSGGGIAADNLTVNHARFLGNRASNSSSFSNSPGGGIAAGKLIVRDSSFVGNFGSGGGAISAGDASLTNVLVSGNSAESEVEDCGSTDGGGLRLGRGVLTNVTITGNTVSGTGGGLSIGSGSLTNVTVTNNLAGPQCGPGGPFDGGGGGGLIGSAILKNTIVAKNQHLVEPFEAGDLVEDNCRGQFTSLGHNLDSGATCELSGPGDLHNTAPKLGPLTDNGGPTLTHALLAGSPAIDAGSNTGCPAKDQRGVARPQDGNRDGVAVCDIGAFELQVPADTQAPSTSARVVPAANPAGWHRGSVSIMLTASDDAGGSGVKSVTYSATGAQPIAHTTVGGGTATVAIGVEGITTLRYFATDKAGNQERTKTLTVRIDATSPVVTFTGNQGTYTVDQVVSITCTAVDPRAGNGQAGSGVASTTCRSVSGPSYTFEVGANTVSATATDVAGNVGTSSTTFTVRVTFNSLCTLSRQLVSTPGLGTAMCNVLEVAERMQQRGIGVGTARALDAYARLVDSAHRAGGLSAEEAAVLKRLANALK